MKFLLEDLFTIQLTGNFVGERRAQSTNPYGPIKSYLLTNLVVGTKKIFKDRVTASMNIQNLFDTKWVDPGFRTADGNLYSTVLEQAGISAIFKVGVHF